MSASSRARSVRGLGWKRKKKSGKRQGRKERKERKERKRPVTNSAKRRMYFAQTMLTIINCILRILYYLFIPFIYTSLSNLFKISSFATFSFKHEKWRISTKRGVARFEWFSQEMRDREESGINCKRSSELVASHGENAIALEIEVAILFSPILKSTVANFTIDKSRHLWSLMFEKGALKLRGIK